jgi:uncharacterized SAM-binding protein YcdF (DUF218 family)
MTRTALFIFGICVAALIAGAQYFAHSVRVMPDGNSNASVFSEDSTGIVVPTGHPGRVTEGIRLLAENHARRLLISGAGEGVSKSDIRKIVAASGTVSSGRLDTVMSCCVDLGFEAADTAGNAAEAKAWAGRNNLDNLIIVTSDFHVPRAMIAFRNHFPEENLMVHRVKTPWLELDRDGYSEWWRGLERISLITGEMIKYIAQFAVEALKG